MVKKKQIDVVEDLLNMEQICQFVQVLCVFLCVKYMTVVGGKSAPPACVCVSVEKLSWSLAPQCCSLHRAYRRRNLK